MILYDEDGTQVFDTDKMLPHVHIDLEEPYMLFEPADETEIILSFTYEDMNGDQNVELQSVKVTIPPPQQVEF